MKIIVPVKRVIDANIKPRVKSDLSGVETQHVKMAANPFDEIAMEEALRLKETGKISEIIAVSIGPKEAQDILRAMLALGADRAILIETNQTLQPLAVAKILKVLVVQEKPELLILGKQAIDDDNNQTGQMLAALLNWPQATFASKVTLMDNRVQVVREVDGGLQILNLDLPCLMTTDLRLNVPRLAKLIDIMKAKQKKIDIIAADSLGIDLTPSLKILKVEPPPPRKLGIKVESVDQLIDNLRTIEGFMK